MAAISATHLTESVPGWTIQAIGTMLMGIAFAYGAFLKMKVYQLAAYVTGCVVVTELALRMTVVMIHDSRWVGATSFAAGIVWFFVAVGISSWKAGWLRGLATHLQGLLTVESETANAPP